MTQAQRGSYLIDIEPVSRRTTDTVAVYAITAVDPSGSPADQITITPTTSVTNNLDGSWSILRAANGSGDTPYTVTASGSIGATTKGLTVPQQTMGGDAVLSVTDFAMTSTTATVTYTFTGAATYSKNGTLVGSASEPLAVTKPSSGSPDDQYILIVTGTNGSQQQYPFSVPAQPTSGTTATDLASAIALANAMHTVLTAKGWMS